MTYAVLPTTRGGDTMRRARRIVAVLSIAGTLFAIAPIAEAKPGPGSKPQCAGGKFPGGNGNPHCPQNK
jgi:hypothetical protein